MTYSIIQSGGKQYKVKKGDIVKLERIAANEGENISLNNVLMTFDEKGEKLNIGTPYLADTTIQAQVLKQGKNKKITVIKYKPKVRYKKKTGHRQFYTQVKILNLMPLFFLLTLLLK